MFSRFRVYRSLLAIPRMSISSRGARTPASVAEVCMFVHVLLEFDDFKIVVLFIYIIESRSITAAIRIRRGAIGAFSQSISRSIIVKSVRSDLLDAIETTQYRTFGKLVRWPKTSRYGTSNIDIAIISTK